MAAVTYQSVLQELNNFSLADAANGEAARKMVEEFMNEIRPKIDQVLRENPNLTAEQKRAFDLREEAIFKELADQYPGGGKRRKARKSRQAKRGGRKALRKSRKNAAKRIHE